MIRYFNPVGADSSGLKIYNLGTGKGYSVIEIINAFKKAVGKEVPYKIIKRRAGDMGECYVNSERAKNELNRTAKGSLEDMCKDFWRWQQIGIKNV